MLTIKMIVEMLVWPAVANAVVLATAWIPAVARSRAAELVAPAAITVGFIVAFTVVVGAPALIPALDAKARLPHVAVLAFGLAVLVVIRTRPRLLTVGWLLGSVAAVWLVLGAAIEFQWSASEAVIRVGVLALGLAATTGVASRFVQRTPPRTASLGLAVLAGVAAPLMVFSDSLLVAQLHGGLGVTASVTALAVWIAPTRIPLRAAAPVVITIAWAHWVIALLFASMPLASFLLLAAAAPAAVLAHRAIPTWSARRRAVASILALGLLVGGSVLLGGLRYARTSAPAADAADSSSYGYYP